MHVLLAADCSQKPCTMCDRQCSPAAPATQHSVAQHSTVLHVSRKHDGSSQACYHCKFLQNQWLRAFDGPCAEGQQAVAALTSTQTRMGYKRKNVLQAAHLMLCAIREHF